MNVLTIIKWLVTNRKIAFKAILGLAVAFLLSWCVIVSKQNKTLSESLKNAQNNIEAYQGYINDSQQANNVLKLDVKRLSQQNDEILQQLDSVRKELKIKSSQITTAATQNQTLHVNSSKGVRGDLIDTIKDTVYTDTIRFNNLTSVYYSISRDTVSMELNLQNKQYLYVYKKREYKNKKSFIKRLFTFDFKKICKDKYMILNTNDLLKSEDVRIVESTEK